MFDVVPNICGNELENDGAAWIAAKWIFPILSLCGVWNRPVTSVNIA
jgi:hypothetical protein